MVENQKKSQSKQAVAEPLKKIPDSNPKTILSSDPDFAPRRSAFVLETCKWLWPVMNRIHSAELGEQFWIRVLTEYVSATFNQREFYQKSNFDYPIPFQPVGGWSPPGRKRIRREKTLTLLRAIRSRFRDRGNSKIEFARTRIALGIRADRFSQELNATCININWIPCIIRKEKNARKRLITEALKQEENERRNILIGMPRLYCENFSRVLDVAESTTLNSITDIFVEHYGSRFEKILATYLSEKGARIWQLQTGGFVGETKNSLLPINRAQYDHLLTYGWTEGYKDVPYYGVRLEEFAEKFRLDKTVKKQDILFVFGSPENLPEIREYYEVCTKVLLMALDRRKFPRILLRPRAHSRALNLSKTPACFKNFDKDEIDLGICDIADLCSQSRIIAHWMLPSTNFLECIFVDQPVVAVDTNYNSSRIFEPYLKRLKLLNIIHENPHAMIEFLNQVKIDEWWAEVRASEAYIELKWYFARSKKQYLSQVTERAAKIPQA